MSVSSLPPRFDSPNFGSNEPSSTQIDFPNFDAPVGSTRNPVVGSLAHDLAQGTATAALSFAGQGWRWWDDLDALLLRRSWIRPRALAWAELIAEYAAEPAIRDLGGASSSFAPLQWIQAGASRPSAGELAALPLSLPGVLLTQLLCYREAWEDGLSQAVQAGSVLAATGHSGGLLAAAAVAAQPDGLEQQDLLQPFLQMAVLLGQLSGTCEQAVSAGALGAALHASPEAETPMVAVSGIRVDRLQALLDDLNSSRTGSLGPANEVRIGLHHGAFRAVISGSPKALRVAHQHLLAQLALTPTAAKFSWEPLAVSSPCHHPMLESVRAEVVSQARQLGIVLPAPSGVVALVTPDGPRVLGQSQAPVATGPTPDLLGELTAAMLTRPGYWDRTAVRLSEGSLGFAAADWILDLGPSDGIAKLSAQACRGTSTRVVALATEKGRRELVTVGAASEGTPKLYSAYAPRVVTLPDGSRRLENFFTKASGRSPMVLPGMTPTTVDAGIVAAAANQGFCAELAGGGQVTEAVFAERIRELVELLVPGQEVVFNALHLDPYLWGLHLGRTRLVQAARRAGAPICGVTISAGIPATEDAVALLDELAELGIWLNAFKPGTLKQIRQVVAIAAAAPHHNVFVHVEGGTAGGHHSWESLEDLLLASYHLLRDQPNIVVCVGGGIGTPESATEFLTGTWSLPHVGVPMPVDAVLLGTVTMAAQEATATAGVKEALRRAQGTNSSGGTHGFVLPEQVAGSVTSGRSGLDADIHFLHNSASRCAALLDEVAGDAKAVAGRKLEIIAALELTAKPYFGDPSEMTYEQFLVRFVQLTARGRQGRYEDGLWLDRSHRERFIALLQRAEARLDPRESGRIPTRFSDSSSVDDPSVAIARLLSDYPLLGQTQLHPADPGYFLFICKQPGKPVPFVPVIDADVRRWYQSDSLWQAQHPDFDADSVLVIPGPAAVGGIAVIDEPIAEILGGFEAHVIDHLTALGQLAEPVDRLLRRGSTAELTGPAAALLEAKTVLMDGRILPNPVHAFGTVEDWSFSTEADGRIIQATCVLSSLEHVVLHVGERKSADAQTVTLTLSFPALAGYGERVPDHMSVHLPSAELPQQPMADAQDSVELRFEHRSHNGVDVLQLDSAARVEALDELLRKVLIRTDIPVVALGSEITLEVSSDLRRRAAYARLVQAETAGELPDAWLAVVWPAVFATLGAPEIVGSLLDLVHLEHQVSILGDLSEIRALDGDLTVRARVCEISDHELGTRVDTVAEVRRGAVAGSPAGSDEPVLLRISGGFLLRGVRELAHLNASFAAKVESGSLTSPEIHDTPRRTLGSLEICAPISMESFAALSGDHNPLHRSRAIALLAGLDGPIVHGAWTSAIAQRAAIEFGCNGDSERLVQFHAKFIAPVMPGEAVKATLTRTALRAGRTIVEINVVVQREGGHVPALIATAELLPPPTAYVFPGQGIQQPGMGMDGYERSAAARHVWDRADLFTREQLGFSILAIVRENPSIISADGELHRHPQGVLNLTQFTQVALAALAAAQVAELRERGVFDERAVVAGHSVGEYNALAALGQVLSLESVVELVFRRGQAMHQLVPRDADGNSQFRLGVIRPHLLAMNHQQIEALVVRVREQVNSTLEIVNFNMRDKQYAVTGTGTALDALDQELLAVAPSGSRPAFVYVPGIDVPFHSSALVDGVGEFRKHLARCLPERIDPAALVGRYVPNLVPEVFSLERRYVKQVSDYVDSAVLKKILTEWHVWSADSGLLCRELLIELLAWQFASPVRWIETQDLLFTEQSAGGLGCERVIEVGLGVAPTLTNLAKGTLALDDRTFGRVSVQNIETDSIKVFATDEETEADSESELLDSKSTELPAPETVPVVTVPVVAGPVVDSAVDAAEAMRHLIAHLCKIRIDQLSATESIDDLVDGVSSRRNQILMDLGAEFTISGVDGARELPLAQLASELATRSKRYSFPGAVLREVRESALAPVLGPRRIKTRDVTARVTDFWALGTGWAERVLMILAADSREGDSGRGGALGRLHPMPTSGANLIDAAVQLAADDAGLVLSPPGVTAAAGEAVDAAAVTALEQRIAGPDGLLADAAREMLRRVSGPEESVGEDDTSVVDRLTLLETEHGERRAAAVAPAFDARRHVVFRSWWGMARHDIVALHHAGLRAEQDAELHSELDAEAGRLARYQVDPGVQASARWFATRAAARGDVIAEARFLKILGGEPWVVPVPAQRPVLATDLSAEQFVGGAEETAADESRIDEFIAEQRILPSMWAETFADQLDLLRGVSRTSAANAFSTETALITGASPGSIAVEVVSRLLAGGAKVICTTTHATPERLGFYRELYNTCAAPGAELHVIPANMASFADIDELVDWLLAPVIDRSGGFARTVKDPLHPTMVLPFAAGPVLGDLPDAGPASEVSMRVLLWGVERLVGRLTEATQRSGTGQRRIKLVLPFSPNHGDFGGDGAYGEAKAALEVLSEKWISEQARWGHQIDLVTVKIGWVRGTGLMENNGGLGALIERDLGVRTFSSAEMGWMIAALCSPEVTAVAQQNRQAEPVEITADFTGGLADIGGLRAALAPLVAELESQVAHLVRTPSIQDADESIPALLSAVGLSDSQASGSVGSVPRELLRPTCSLHDMVVVLGAGEVGPWGSSVTRFDLEVEADLADGSIAELAWTCGLIRWESDLDGGSWVDAATDEAVAESVLAEQYREQVLALCGIRTYEVDGPLNPDGVPLLVEVFLERDVVITAADETDARAFAAADPENTSVLLTAEGDWQVVRRAGSAIRVPRRAKLSRRVGAQIPSGFDPMRWGIPAEMAASVDRLSLWNLVATVEAFLDAGIEPEELMARVHPARVGNTQGSGMGGMSSVQTLYRDSVLGGDHANDILQEGLSNVVAAYVMQSYVGGYGPMVHPVAACATAAVSVEDAVDKIRAGKADVIVAGGWDDLQLEGVLGFSTMSATAASDHMEAAGFEPRQYSRANDVRRAGFVEAQGGGTVLLARGSVAADLGLPVRAVVVYASSFADGIHTSIPAPGLGALSCVLGAENSPLAQALTKHGLTADDLAVVSKHDTSTGANDPNESELHQRIATALGRTPGNPLLVVSQKTVTGHAKGGSAAWQMIGLMQVLESGEIPGNRNLECLDESHRDHQFLAYGHRSILAGEPLKAGLLSSLGFGHVSAVLCLGSAEVFTAALIAESGEQVAASYQSLAASRQRVGKQRRLENRYGVRPGYSKRVERRLRGAENSAQQRLEEVMLLTDPSVRLGADGLYAANLDLGSE